MEKAIGMLEYKTVSVGILAADLLIKLAPVELIKAYVVCPGKYIIIFRGELGAIQIALEGARKNYPKQLIDSFCLGNPHEEVFKVIYGRKKIQKRGALGILETRSAAAIFVAADVAAKTADIELVKIRAASGMCGKSFVILTGQVAAVEAAVRSAESVIKKTGMYLDSAILPNPDTKLYESI